eukprot:3919247-Rhodomonas_salina.1
MLQEKQARACVLLGSAHVRCGAAAAGRRNQRPTRADLVPLVLRVRCKAFNSALRCQVGGRASGARGSTVGAGS